MQTHHRRSCKWCGAPVDEFCDEETGLWIYLQPEPIPINVDINAPGYRYRVYELLPGIGWHRKWTSAGRNWRELRCTHECPGMPRQRRTSAPDGRM